jgi:hypothetical protein
VNPEEKNRADGKNAQASDELNQIEHLLRRAMPPLPTDQLEPRADLWPQLRTRIESQLNANRTAENIDRESPSSRVPWLDWALAALAAAALIFFPGLIPALLYHF